MSIFVKWSMKPGPYLTKNGQATDIAVEGVHVLR